MSGEALDKVATQLQSIDYRQSLLRPLSPMLSSADILLNLDTVFAGYRKRLSDLGQMAEEGRLQARHLMDRVESMVAAAGHTLKELIGKRQRDTKLLSNKAAAVEVVYGQVQEESQISVRALQVALKEEAAEMSTNIDFRLQEERSQLLARLEKLKSTQTAAVKAARSAAKKASVELLEYGRENSEKLWILKSSTPMSQNSRLSSEDAKATILAEVTSRLTKGMQSMKDHLDSKCASLSSKYTEELRKLKGEVENARERILGQREEATPQVEENPVNRLTGLNGDIRRLLNRIGAFCAKGLMGITEATKAIRRALALVDQEGISEQGQVMLRENKKQLEGCQKQLSDIATKLKSDFYGVQEALNEGKSLVVAKGGKLAVDQRPGFDVQKELRLRLEKEV